MLQNKIILHNGYVEVQITKTGQRSYSGSMLLDTEDLHKVGKVRISMSGYAYTTNTEARSVSHIVMSHTSNRRQVVDHINGNRLDNRKSNLRVISIEENSNNRHTSRNNTGVVGIALREKGNYKYYRVTVSDIRTPTTNRGARKKVTKQFNINRLGKEEAFKQAKSWLYKKRKEFGYIDY